MRSAFALRIFSGRIILNFAFVALCGALQTHFHGRGWNELPQSKPDGFASSLGEGAFGIAGKFLAKVQALRVGTLPGGSCRAATEGL